MYSPFMGKEIHNTQFIHVWKKGIAFQDSSNDTCVRTNLPYKILKRDWLCVNWEHLHSLGSHNAYNCLFIPSSTVRLYTLMIFLCLNRK